MICDEKKKFILKLHLAAYLGHHSPYTFQVAVSQEIVVGQKIVEGLNIVAADRDKIVVDRNTVAEGPGIVEGPDTVENPDIVVVVVHCIAVAVARCIVVAVEVHGYHHHRQNMDNLLGIFQGFPDTLQIPAFQYNPFQEDLCCSYNYCLHHRNTDWTQWPQVWQW